MAPSAVRPDVGLGDADAPDEFVKHSLSTSMFFPQSRLMIAGNPKVAGTSLRWWLLPLHGIDVEAMTKASLWGESAPYQTVWDSSVDLTFTWNYLSPDDRRDALTATDVLTVHPVRHPVTRAFSAWSGKYLNHESYYNDRLPDGFPTIPDSIDSEEQIAQLFEEFVVAMAGLDRDSRWSELDVHFWPQHRLLGRRPAGEVLVLRQEAMSQGLTAVGDHLRRFGLDPSEVPRFNETIVGYQQALITSRALDELTSLYAPDFAAWSYPPEAPASKHHELDLSWLNDVRGRNRRYQVIHQAAIGGRKRERELEQAMTHARNREQELLASLSWRMTRPLRGMADLARRVLRRRQSS